MTDSERQQLNQFEARVRQLLLQYKTLQADNQQLMQQVATLQGQVEGLNQQIDQLQLDYKTLKTARMIEVSDIDMKNAKQTITQLVREVNKCIGLLSAEQYLGEDKSEQMGKTASQPDDAPMFVIEPEPMPAIQTEEPIESKVEEPTDSKDEEPVELQPKQQPEVEELTLPFD